MYLAAASISPYTRIASLVPNMRLGMLAEKPLQASGFLYCRADQQGHHRVVAQQDS